MFRTTIEVRLASEKELATYYEVATNSINLLLTKYNIRNAQGEMEQVFADQLRALLSFDGFFQATPLKSIFLDQKKQFIPHEIIHAFRSIISNPPINIKAVFFNTFITLLMKRGWDKPLITYFEKQYSSPPNSVIVLDDLKDFSLGAGVYKATFQLSTMPREKVVVFLKSSCDIASYNELLYFHLQKELLATAKYAQLPCRLLSGKSNEELLLLPLIPGVASDTALSIITQAYGKTTNAIYKSNLKKALEVLIEAFISHAALGDLLGRNDRHLMNSLIAFAINNIPQKNTLEDLMCPEKILAYIKNIVTEKVQAISLIDIDLKWLLEEKNANWALADIDFGLSELNLLSLLTEFNDYNFKTNSFFEKRKEYVAHYFNVYDHTQKAILKKKELLFSAIKKIYPANIAEKKLNLLDQKINNFENSKEPVVKLFRRYLLDFRIRLIHKATLTALDKMAKKSTNTNLLNALREAELLKYLPPYATFASYESSVFLQLQCFRGVLSKKDGRILAERNKTSWESVAYNIARIAETFNSNLFKALEDKKQFIQEDTIALLKSLPP